MKKLTFAMTVLLVFTLSATIMAKPKKPKNTTSLNGTLTIDFTVPNANPILAKEFEFTVTDQEKVAGIEIPEAIRGGTFETNEEFGDCALDTTAGSALLRLKQKDIGTVFKALVTSGAFFCLLLDGATNVDTSADPFKCSENVDPLINAILCSDTEPDKVLNSAIAEGAVWFAQIFADDSFGEDDGKDNLTEMREFFDIPIDRTLIRAKISTIESSQESSGNRGGSALG